MVDPCSSIDAEDGTVPPTEVEIGRGGQEAQGRRSAGVGSRWKTCRRHAHESLMGQSIGAPSTSVEALFRLEGRAPFDTGCTPTR